MKNKNGITLIALVITIIVLLILAGVSISLTLGNNGVLSQATNAVTVSGKAKEKEKLQMEVASSYGTDLKLAVQTLKDNINSHIEDIASITGSKFPLTVRYNSGNVYKIKEDGSVEEKIPLPSISAGQKAENSNAEYTDANGHVAIIPKGFTVSNVDGEKSIETGLVIRDDDNNEFVWIPVGIARKSDTTKTIDLGRYIFDSDGNITASAFNPGDQLKTSPTSTAYYYEETPREVTGAQNAVAKNINEFVSKTEEAGGFWIGRYEARKKSVSGGYVCSENKSYQVYEHLYQSDAANKAKTMYDENDYFESDLVNSFAWDTATLFLQEYDNRINKDKIYSRQNSLVTSQNSYGTTTDKICNVYDMASNLNEYSTESSSSTTDRGPCFMRGGFYMQGNGYIASYTSLRLQEYTNLLGYDGRYGFRPILYLKKI